MKIMTLGLCAILTGCVSNSTIENTGKDHSFERLTCVDSSRDMMNIQKEYKLVFFARNFTENVQVWLQPKTGKTVMTKVHHNMGKTCYVFNGFPTEMYDR